MVINGDMMVIINDDVKEYPIYEMENNPFMFQITNQIDYPKIWNGQLSQPDRFMDDDIPNIYGKS